MLGTTATRLEAHSSPFHTRYERAVMLLELKSTAEFLTAQMARSDDELSQPNQRGAHFMDGGTQAVIQWTLAHTGTYGPK